ncbi:hypothetical protein AAE478_006043 [Parahypoxylon ruwenzoriense]
MSHYDDNDNDNSRGHPNNSAAYGEIPRVASPGHTTYNSAPEQNQLTYEPHTPFYPPPPQPHLQVPESRSRPRSLPPPIEYRRSVREGRRGRGCDRDRDSDSDDSDDGRTRTPVEKARDFVDNNFSNSATGLGVGVLGALVGGLAAREAVEASSRHGGHLSDAKHKRNQLIGTVVGAAVGALGANAVEKRIEINREKDRLRQEKWERKWRPDGDVFGKREVVARPRSTSGGGGWRKNWDSWDDREREREQGRDHGRSRGLEREVDPEARSWKNVEDWLNDERNGEGKPRSSGQRSVDNEYRY